MIYLFDVDGTITSSRRVMDPNFKKFFKQLPEYSLVTGSDIDKTVEQVGQDIFNNAKFCFNCSGNDVYQWGKALTRNAWIPNQDVLDLLEKYLQESPYKHRFGNHIEQRPGMINFSVVGRNAIGKQRQDYHKWDKKEGERIRIAVNIKWLFTDLTAEVGGETGIDIYPRGCDKSQVLKYFRGQPIHFFGDRCEPGGNDHSIAKILSGRKNCKVSHVKDWKETCQILQNQKFMNHPTAA